MRLWILSDLHCDVSGDWAAPDIPEADVAIVAGDVCEGLVRCVEWLSATIRPRMPVVLVPGNHEFYRCVLQPELVQGRARARALDIALLDNDEIVVGGVRFLGATLWTDYELSGAAQRDATMALAGQLMNDHRSIRFIDATDGSARETAFSPAHALALHRCSRRWLGAAFERPSAGPTVVVTHHGPHPRSIHPRYAGKPLNAGFASDLSDEIERWQPELWVHGHTHANIDCRIGRTRLLCNPKGYPNENGEFDPALIVEV